VRRVTQTESGLTLVELRERAGLSPNGAADRPGGLNRLAPDQNV